MDAGYTGNRPWVQRWHGDADPTISPNNQTEAIKKWTNVLGLARSPTSTTTVPLSGKTWTRQSWQSACGFTVLDAWLEQGGPHGTSANLNAQDVIQFLSLDKSGDVDPEAAACAGEAGLEGTGGASGTGGRPGAGGSGGSGTGKEPVTPAKSARAGVEVPSRRMGLWPQEESPGPGAATANVVHEDRVEHWAREERVTGGSQGSGGQETGSSTGNGGALSTRGHTGSGGSSASGGSTSPGSGGIAGSGGATGGGGSSSTNNGGSNGCHCALGTSPANRQGSPGTAVFLGLAIAALCRRRRSRPTGPR